MGREDLTVSPLFAFSSVETMPLGAGLAGAAAMAPQGNRGWGLGCYEGADAQLIRDPVNSGLIEHFVSGYQRPCGLCLSSKAASAEHPAVLANCQPFARELQGVTHLFAMDGELEGLDDKRKFPTGPYAPVGDTSAERAFCVLMSRMRVLWHEEKPLPEVRLAVVSDFAARLRPHGLANFIYSDSELLFVHGHQQADDPAQAGLYLALDGVQARVSSRPLDSTDWQGLEPGEVLVIRGAEVLERCPPFKLWSQLRDSPV
jgi:glutamine amidotransferase